MKSAGVEFVRSEVEYIPAQLNVIDYYRETYECRSCKNIDEPQWLEDFLPWNPDVQAFCKNKASR